MKKDQIDIFKKKVFGYEDYRNFLKDYFNLQKKLRSSFTQRYFASKAGFSNHTFCNYVINGKRNLSSTTLQKFIDALELNDTSAKYFENLVKYNQATTQEEKEEYYGRLKKIKKSVKFVSVNKSQEFFFGESYYATLRELVVHAGWNGSFDELAKSVRPNITTSQAKKGVADMVEVGILKLKRGTYSFGCENINDLKVPVFLKKKSRKQVFERAVESLDALSPDERYAVYSTFSSDEETYEKINKLFEQFRKDCNELILDSKNSDRVYQMVFGNFPISYKK